MNGPEIHGQPGRMSDMPLYHMHAVCWNASMVTLWHSHESGCRSRIADKLNELINSRRDHMFADRCPVCFWLNQLSQDRALTCCSINLKHLLGDLGLVDKPKRIITLVGLQL